MTATDTSYLFAPRWAEMADGKSSLFEMVPWLEERDRKLEDFLTAIYTSSVDASYNFYSRNRASAAYDGANFYGEDTAHPLLTLYNFTTDTATCFHHDGTNNQVDVFAKDLTTYRPIKASAFTVSSSRATKTEIRPYTDAPRLSPVRFVRDGKEQVGFIAEEVQALFPEASDGTGVDLMPVVASLMERVNRLEHGS